MKQPLPPPPRGRPERLDGLLVAAGGRGGLAGVLRILNAFPAATGAAAVVLLDVTPAVAGAFATYASRFSAIRVEAPPSDARLVPDVAYVVSTRSPALVLSGAEGTWLRTLAPPAGSDPAHAVTYLYASAVDRFGSRVVGVVLAGAPRGTRDGLRAVRKAGGAVLGPDPATVADGAALQALLADGCYVKTSGADALGIQSADALRTGGARR
jgi:chemotaxis response regulator CheB